MTETAMNDAKTFMDSGTKHVNVVYKQGNRIQSENSQCYRCGSTNHLANDQLCPAKNARCKKCGKTGHFARVCKSSTTSVNEVDLPEVTVLCVSRKTVKGKLTGNFTVTTPQSQSYISEMLVDTGSGASIIPKHIYMAHFKKRKLSPPMVQLQTYSKHKLRVL